MDSDGSTGRVILPRFIRLRDAAFYLGMDRNRFNKEVRPFLQEIPIGVQGIAFDRIDMDRWADYYRACNGRPAQQGESRWDANLQGCTDGKVFGTSTNGLKGKDEFARVVRQARSVKQRICSQRLSGRARKPKEAEGLK